MNLKEYSNLYWNKISQYWHENKQELIKRASGKDGISVAEQISNRLNIEYTRGLEDIVRMLTWNL